MSNARLTPPYEPSSLALSPPCLVLLFYMLDSNRNHSLESIDSIISSIMEVPADDSQLSQNAAKISWVTLPLEVSPHECRVSRLEQVGQVMNIIADRL
jgi:hypothetical protein